MYLHLISFPHTKIARVVEILLYGKQGPTYISMKTPWLLMGRWRRSQGTRSHDIDIVHQE